MALCLNCKKQLTVYQKYLFAKNSKFQNVLSDNRIYQCSSCKLIQANHAKIDKKKLEDYYKNSYSFHKVTEQKKLRKNTKNIVRGLITLNHLKKYLKNKNQNYDFFELGAGYGTTLITLKDYYSNSNIYASEPGEILHEKVLADEAGKKYDAIILNHVLEHLVFPHDYIYELIGKLNKNGILYIEVPNDNDLFLKNKVFNSPHISFFTLKSSYNFFSRYKNELDLLEIGTYGDCYRPWSLNYNYKHRKNFLNRIFYKLNNYVKKFKSSSDAEKNLYSKWSKCSKPDNNINEERYFLRSILRKF